VWFYTGIAKIALPPGLAGWENFDRPQGEPPGPTEKRRREEEEREEREKKRRRGEEKIMLTLGMHAWLL